MRKRTRYSLFIVLALIAALVTAIYTIPVEGRQLRIAQFGYDTIRRSRDISRFALSDLALSSVRSRARRSLNFSIEPISFSRFNSLRPRPA